jgi:hypothetical protein
MPRVVVVMVISISFIFNFLRKVTALNSHFPSAIVRQQF